MQVGSISGANLGLCWRLFGDFLPLASRSDLEVVLASIFLRFRTTSEDGKPARQLSSLGLLVACFASWFVGVFHARCLYVFHVCVFVFGAFYSIQNR